MSELDFGDDATIGANLKRRDFRTLPATTPGLFAVYLGQRNGQFVVGLKDLLSWDIINFKRYDSLADLQRDYILD